MIDTDTNDKGWDRVGRRNSKLIRYYSGRVDSFYSDKDTNNFIFLKNTSTNIPVDNGSSLNIYQ